VKPEAMERLGGSKFHGFCPTDARIRKVGGTPHLEYERSRNLTENKEDEESTVGAAGEKAGCLRKQT
jgi:hypothetical protein